MKNVMADKKILKILTGNKRLFRIIGIAFVIGCVFEFIIFNMHSLFDLGIDQVIVAKDVHTGDDGTYVSDVCHINEKVSNVFIELNGITNAEYADVNVSLTDEGDEYEYDMPIQRVVPGITESGYIRIYPYGKVKDIRVHVAVSDGASADISKISINSHRPYKIMILRLIVIWLVSLLLIITFTSGYDILLERGNRAQLICTVACMLVIMAFGRWLSTSNDLIVSCPWPHHKQYQELAQALDDKTVQLTDHMVSEGLRAKENPYDTGALMAEQIPYEMDYAYYNGAYYVYFGIIPELLLYYPFYKLTGMQLSNHNAAFLLYIILVAGVFLCIREIAFRYDKKGLPFVLYLMTSVTACLLSNIVYLISRPDIYNIPILAATAFTFLGLGLWFFADASDGMRKKLSLVFGSLCMAAVAGCRPQMLLFSLSALFIFIFRQKEDDSRLNIKDRTLFKKETLTDTLLFCIPFVLVAIPVCWYNAARFGNIFDFGATYSLTSNDMNHRGFNFDRLFRGLYCFFLQPAVRTTDFPFIDSSVISSDYMGKNLTEFTYGGTFVTNLILSVVIVPVFVRLKKMKGEAEAVVATLLSGSFVIAAFDINGAGILYRYTCDMIPGLILAAMIVWMILLDNDDAVTSRVIEKIFVVLALMALCYSFMVFMAPSGSLALYDTSVVTYEKIHQYFRF